MPAIENVLKETAGVATGLLLFAAGGGSPAGVAAGAAAVSGIALWSMLQGMVEKSGLESRTAVNALRRRAFADLKTYEERMDVEGANAALADLLPHALPKGEALVEASFDPKGFPTSATALILAELAVLNSDLFGAAAPRAGIKFAEDVIQTTLKAALETPEYYQKLQPHMTVEQNRRLAEMRDALGALQHTADSIKTDTTDLLEGQAKILAYFEAAEARGALKIGEAAGLNRPQVEALLKNFGHENVPLDQAEGLLLKAAEELRDLRMRMVRLSNADPEVARLKGEAARAIDAGRFDEARALLLRAAERDREAAAELKDALAAHSLSAAESLTLAAGVARTQAKLLEAADLYRDAADLAEPIDAEAAFYARSNEAQVLYDHGLLFPGLGPLARSAAVWSALADKAPNATRRAAIENNLGNALATLGARAGGAVGLGALNRAVQAFEAALRVYTEADMPADWAMTQNNLGTALQALGERAGGAAELEALNRAVQAYDAALRVRTEADMPADWAMTQNNLGAALSILGERAGGAAGLDALNRAVQAFETALRVRTEADMPAQWAMTQNNLGNALQTLGERADGAAELEALNRAVQAYDAALRVYTEVDMPAAWATTQNNLGTALSILGERAGGAAGLDALNRAVQPYEAALRVYTEADMPAQWAFTTENLAVAFRSLSEIDGDGARLDQAIGLMDRVIPVYEGMQAGYYVEKAQRNRAGMIALRDRLSGAD